MTPPSATYATVCRDGARWGCKHTHAKFCTKGEMSWIVAARCGGTPLLFHLFSGFLRGAGLCCLPLIHCTLEVTRSLSERWPPRPCYVFISHLHRRAACHERSRGARAWHHMHFSTTCFSLLRALMESFSFRNVAVDSVDRAAAQKLQGVLAWTSVSFAVAPMVEGGGGYSFPPLCGFTPVKILTSIWTAEGKQRHWNKLC